MKTILYLILFLLPLISFSQIMYPLGENEFSQEKEEQTIFTSFNELSHPILKDSIDLSYKFPPAGDQGTKGSCWAWATTYAMRSAMDNQFTYMIKGKIDYSKVYSPEYVYQYYKGDISDCNWGAFAFEVLANILKDGAVKINDFPNNDLACNIQPSNDLREKAKQNCKLGYTVQKLNDLYSIKKVLNENQPLIIGIKVDDYFRTKGNITSLNPFWTNFGTRTGVHAMVVVGYNDRLSSLKVLNSYGSEFGDKGYVWISYSIINSAMNYCCYPKKELENLPQTTNSNPEAPDNLATKGSNSYTTWFKERYFRIFEKVKIVLAQLNVSKEFAVIEIRDNDDNLLTNFYIELKSSKEFYIDHKKYKFTFNSIGRAGRNPFTKAVFFTIEFEE